MNEAAVAPVETAPDVLAVPHPVPQPRRKVLLTGAGGMLGSDLAPALVGGGFEVFARPKSDLDITDEGQVSRAFHEIRPEVVVNCAAFTKVDDSERDPRAYAVNAYGVSLLAEHCLLHGAQLTQISTDFVFDGSGMTPYREDGATGPLSAYGKSKLQGEQAALRVPNSLVVRSSWLFGLAGWNFIEAILQQVEGGKRRLTVVDNQRGRPTATTDLAGAVLALLCAGAVGIYHFANRGDVTWLDFAREILQLSNRRDVEVQPIDSATLARPAERPAYSVLDTSKYEKLTGQPIRHFQEPLAEYLVQRQRPEA